MRADAFGFFWDTQVVERGQGPKIPRPIPPIPDNGWKPREFPRLEKAYLIGLDTETKDPDLEEKGPGVRRDGKMVGISVATEDNQSWYFPMRHEFGDNLPVENVLRWARDNLTRPNQPKVGTNLLYDIDYLAEEGVNVAGPFYDVQTAEALINENAMHYSLDAIAHRHLGEGKVEGELEEWALTAYGEKNWKANIWRCPSNLVGPYAEADALLPIRILAEQRKMLAAEGLLPIWEVEVAQVPLLLAMRRRGVRVDLKKAQRIDDQLTQKIAEEKARLNALVGFDMENGEKKHLIRLFDEQNLTYPRTAATSRFPTGQPSFTKEFLEHHPHPAAQMVVGIRKWEKFKSTFIHGYIFDLHVKGRIHCQFNQLKGDDYGTIARYSSSLPNLQNIPKRDKFWGPLIRGMFMPDKGERWGILDWSQIEYRLLVDRAKHPSAEAARIMYREDPNTDFHEWVSTITKVIRDHAKNINFGLVYGMGEELLAFQLGITVDEARLMFDKYHTNVPFVKQARADATSLANSQGYITTLMGRRRRFDMWEPRYYNREDETLRPGLPLAQAMAAYGNRLRRAYTHKALNGEIQGSAADLMKKAMQVVWASGAIQVLGAPLLTVHDELDWSYPNTQLGREALQEVKRIMETCVKISIPIIADLKTGPNWGATK